jgi:hypothetical protein
MIRTGERKKSQPNTSAWNISDAIHHTGNAFRGAFVASGILPDVEGGILPPGLGSASPCGSVDFKPLIFSHIHSAGLEARLTGRQDACRYG